MTYDFYRVLHFVGLLSLFMGLGGSILAYSALPEGMRLKLSSRMLLGVSHGAGLLLILLGGFGMLAKKSIFTFPFPNWVWVKIALWITLAALFTCIKRGPRQLALLWWLLAMGLGFAAIYAVLIYQRANLL